MNDQINNCPSAATHKNLFSASDYDDFMEKNAENMLNQTLSEHLTALRKQKGLKRAQVARGADLEKGYVCQIFSGRKHPSRDKLIALAFGLRLNAMETQRMLKVGGYSELYGRIGRDALILIDILRGLDIVQTNQDLEDHGFPALKTSV